MFKKAERKQARLKLAITGPSGSGKTLSALILASSLAKKIAVIDTENGSASLYADKYNFDVLEITPPYSVEKYQAAIEAAEKAQYEIIVIDSISHSWAGEGGLLDQKEQLDARGKGSGFTNWASITKKQEQFKNHILHSPCHIICTMRSKQEYVLQDKDGKQVPKKIGMAPIQRDGIEYEFTVVFDLAMNHEAEASKDRTGLYAGKIFKITEDTGTQLNVWLNSGKAQVFESREKVTPETPQPEKTVEVKKETKTNNPADYIVEMNGRAKGKKLKELSLDEIQSNVNYWEKRASDQNQSLIGAPARDVAASKIYLAEMAELRDLK